MIKRIGFHARIPEKTYHDFKRFCVDHNLDLQDGTNLALLHYMEFYNSENKNTEQRNIEEDDRI